MVKTDTTLTVTEVYVACDTIECGYRIVELANGEFAFVWGNIRAHVDDVLPIEAVEKPTADRGVEISPNYEGALKNYRDCAAALQATSSRGGDEMLAILID